ncbi:MAG: hypothetical protein ABSB66_17080 [Candidatus Acidiferrales bacterium]
MRITHLLSRGVVEGVSFEAFVSWWLGTHDAADRRRRVLGVFLLLVCLAVATVGVPRLRIFGHDVFVSLDGGWRVLNGQRPGVDFYAQMGPVYYLLHAAGLWLAGNNARGLGYGSALATALISLWAFFVLRPRMKSAPFFVACLFLALLAAAPFPLGFGFTQATFSMKHNRYGYALTGLVLLESFLPEGAASRRHQFTGGFSTGVACAVLLFLKISFGLVALTLAAVSLPLRSGARSRLAGMAAGFSAFTVPMFAYLRFDLPALVREYRLLARVKAGSIDAYDVVKRIYVDRFEIAPVALLAALVGLLPGVSARRSFTLMLAVAIATIAGTLLLLTNTQPYGLPLLGAAALLLLNEVTVAVPEGSAPPQMAPLLAIGLLAIGIPMCADAAGLGAAIGDKILHPKPGYRFHETHLESIEFVNCSTPCPENDNGQNFVKYTEEGIGLVQTNGHPGESVRGLGMSNPFSFATLRPPSHGGAVTLSKTDISPVVMPPEKVLIGDVTLILAPKFPASEREILTAILNSYPKLLGTEYLRVAESPNWILYRRAN